MMEDRLVRWNAVAQGIDGEIKKNPTQSWGETSSSRTTGLRAVAAWTQRHRHRTTLSSAPTAGVCCRAVPIPFETTHNRVAGSDPPKTPASSAWQTPQRDAARHARSCAQSDSPGFSAYLSLSRLWYAVPPTKGGTTDGQYTVHRCAGAPLRIPGFDQLDPCRVSPVSPALRDGVPRASRRVAPRWEAAHRPPVHGLQELSSPDARRSTVLHSGLPQDLH